MKQPPKQQQGPEATVPAMTLAYILYKFPNPMLESKNPVS